MPDHPTPHPDVAGYILGTLEPDEAAAFAEHLRSCEDCQNEVVELSSLRALLDQALPGPVLPEGLAERTFAAVAAEASADAVPRRGRRRSRLVPAARALAGAAAVVVGLLLAGRTTPAVREIALVAADGGPSGTVARLHREDEGIVVDLDVEDLAAAAPGRFYECWYVGDGDQPGRPARVSAGTFTLPESGRTTVRMTTAADRTRYPRIEVTLEPDDGDPRATGPVVLRSPRRPAAD